MASFCNYFIEILSMFSSLTRAATLLRFVDSELHVQAQKAEEATAARIRKLRKDVRAISRELDRMQLARASDPGSPRRRGQDE
jgi:hypothetical protein